MLGHAKLETTALYTNPRELHHPQDKGQVACSQPGRNSGNAAGEVRP
jgi:hypothetical protein